MSGEINKYNVCEVRWDGNKIYLTIRACEGYTLCFRDGIFKVRYGDKYLTAQTEDYLSAQIKEIMVSGTVEEQSKIKTDVVEYSADIKNGQGKITPDSYSKYIGYYMSDGLTIKADGMVIWDGTGKTECFVVAQGEDEFSMGILSVKSDRETEYNGDKIETIISSLDAGTVGVW